jgi:hypothetical protein
MNSTVSRTQYSTYSPTASLGIREGSETGATALATNREVDDRIGGAMTKRRISALAQTVLLVAVSVIAISLVYDVFRHPKGGIGLRRYCESTVSTSANTTALS